MPSNILSIEQIRNALDAAGNPWEPIETSLSSLPLNVQKQYLGAIPSPGVMSIDEIESYVSSNKDLIRTEAISARINIPTAYDLRNVDGKNFVTPVKHQKECGSCVAFGTIATVESTLLVQNGNPDYPVDISEAVLFFCYGGSCSSGWSDIPAYNAFLNHGIPIESCYTYESGFQNQACRILSDECLRSPQIFKITGITNLTGKPTEIKKWISSKGPVSAFFIVYQDFYSHSGVYKYVTGEQVGGHCVSIVGYNDDQGCWICKNSWGPDYPDQGFFKIAYGECGIDTWSNYGVNGVEIQLINPPDPVDPANDFEEYVRGCQIAGFSREECENFYRNGTFR
jgi:C1A family cysteine protease